jgi:hypothetical protein
LFSKLDIKNNKKKIEINIFILQCNNDLEGVKYDNNSFKSLMQMWQFYDQPMFVSIFVVSCNCLNKILLKNG